MEGHPEYAAAGLAADQMGNAPGPRDADFMDTEKARIAEYQGLRSEVLERIRLRQQILFAVGLAFVAVMSLHLNQPAYAKPQIPLPMIYPLLALFMAMTWSQNDTRIKLVARYIRETFEGPGAPFGWETYVEENRRNPVVIGYVTIPHAFMFCVSEAIALALVGDPQDLDSRTAFWSWVGGFACLIATLVVFILGGRASSSKAVKGAA